MSKMATKPIYGKRAFKNLQNQQKNFHETWYVALRTPTYHSLLKYLWLDLDLFYGKVKFGNLGFSIGKVKTMDSSETIATCDLKVGRCRQLVEKMKVYEYSRSHWSMETDRLRNKRLGF